MTPAFDRDLLALFAMGALDPAEAAPIEAALQAGDAETLAGVAEAQRLVGAIALSSADASVPAGSRERLLERVRREGKPLPSITGRTPPRTSIEPPRAVPLNRAWMAIAAGVLLALGWFARDRLVAPKEHDLSRIVAEAAGDPDSVRWTFKDAGDSSPSSKKLGVVYFQPRLGRLVAMGTSLPKAEAGKVYVLWTLRGGVPTNRGALGDSGVGGVGAVLDQAPPISDIDAVAISLESDPRTPTPTPTAVKAAATKDS